MWFYADAPESYTWGGDVVAYFDNMMMEKFVPTECGTEGHPYPVGDLTQDCHVNMSDLAVLVDRWLASSI